MTKKESKIGSMAAYLYVIIPVFIFCVTWTRIQYAVILGAVLIVSTVLMYRNAPKLPCFSFNLETVITILLIVGFWVYLSGVGGYVYQNTDHTARNGIFNVLVENDWPVVKEVITEEGTQVRGLTYYIGFWLPAALVGKLFGLEAGYFFQYVWAVLGILIVYYLICCILDKLTVWPLVVFIFFGGLDVLGCLATGHDIGTLLNWNHLEWWTDWQFSSVCAQLFWVFNQAIPAWIITFMLYLHKDNKNTLYLWSMGMLSCTLPFVGMIPLIAYFSVRNVVQSSGKVNRKMKEIFSFIGKWIRSFITPQNTVGALCVALVMLTYLTGNTSVANSLEDDVPTKYTLMRWICSFIFEAGIYFYVIRKYQKKNPLFYVCLFWMLICPFINVGGGFDFCMRASIPALLMLYLMVVRTLETAYQHRDRVCLYLLTGLLCISSVTGIFEINRAITNTFAGNFQREASSEESILTGGNFSSDAEMNVFFRYLAR